MKPIRINHSDVHRTHASYLEQMWRDPGKVVATFLAKLREYPLEIDTLIGRGISGALSAQLIATATGLNYAVVRKEGESAHSYRRVEGRVGRRWLFVDDLIDTGETLKATVTAVNTLSNTEGWKTSLQGAFLYNAGSLRIGQDVYSILNCDHYV